MASREAADNELNERITNEANAIHETTNQLQKDLNTETAAREAGDKTLNDRITAVKDYVLKETGDNYVSKTDATVQDGAIVKADKTIGENVTNLDAALAKETAARIGADKAQDAVIQQVNQNAANGIATLATAYNNEVASREAADNELNERITNEANAIHETTNKLQDDLNTETTAREAGDTALDTRITNVKEYLEKQTSDKYVSKTDAAVQDGAIVKAAKTIGENVTNLDAALAKETAARIGADKAQDEVIKQVNQNVADGFNTINTNMANGFAALNAADAAEKEARIGADKKLAEAVNSGLSLRDDNVLQKNTTTVADDGTVTTSKSDANEMILNKGNKNQITLNEKGVKVGTNSSVLDADGIYTGGDTFDAAKAAMSSDGQIKGANGKFTVDASGNTTVTSLDAGTGTIQTKGDLYAKDATFSGDITAKDATLSGDLSAKDGTFSGDLSAKDGTFSGDVSAKDVTATGTLQGAEVTDGTATLKQGKLTGVKDIETEALHVNGDANVTGKLTTKDLEVTGEFNANTLKSRLDENNYTEIHGGNVTSKNLKVDKGVTRTSESSFDENGREEYVTDNDSRATVKVGANEISQTLDDKGNNPKNAASRVLSQNTDNKYEITDSVVEGNQSNVENRTADTTDSQISLKDDSSKVLNKSYITQNLKKVLMGVEEGDNKTTIEQDANNITNTAKNGTIKNDAGKLVNTASDTIANMAGNDITNTSTNGNIANTAANGTISNNAKNLTNTASENITNKAENGNISNIASNGTISNEAKTISNKADEALTNDAKTITNTASESVTTQIGNGSEVQSVMNGDGIANKATGKSITNDAATITNTGTTSVTNQVGENKVLVDTTHVQSAFGDTIYTTWAESGITNNATDKTVATNAKDILNTATGDITNTAKNGTITNDAGKLVNTASDTIANMAGNDITNTSTNGNIANTAANGTISNNAKNLTNTASENITNKAENGNISNIASNGTISNEAKTISNKADEALTNDAKTITNTASESVTTQIGNGSEVQSVMNASGIANKAAGKSITNDAATITNTGTISVTNQVGKNKVLVDTTHVQSAFGDTIYTTWNESGITDKVGENVERTMGTSKITESVKDGTKSNTFTKTVDKDINIVTDGTNTSTESQLAGSVNTSLKNGTQSLNNKMTLANEDGKAEDVTKITDTASGAFSSSSQKADSITNTVKDGNGSNVATDKALSSESKLTSGNSVIDVIKSLDDAANPEITSSVTYGTNTSEVKQTAKDITNTAKNGTITNDAKDLVNNASENMTNTVGKDLTTTVGGEMKTTVTGDSSLSAKNITNTAETIKDVAGKTTVTTTDTGTTFENTAHSTAIEEGTITNTTISGNTLETGQATMDYADVMKDLGVHGKATIDGDTSVGGNLSVTGTSTLTGDVTMKSNATVENDLTVKGTTTTDKLVVSNGATVSGGTTTDTLHVTSTSRFDGAATFKDIVTMEKDLNVGGNAKVAGDVTAKSFKVGENTYIDENGINANNQVIRNVGQGDISEGSTDAVSGGQLYETNTRVSGLETRMGTVETKVDKLDNKIDKVGANAAAMANLHPLEFDEDSKWNIAAAVGSSGSETASAVGVFYRPNENVMVNASAAMGTGENMFGGGVSLRLGQGGNKTKAAQMKAAAKENRELRAKVDDLTARMDALLSVLNPNMSKDFPDVPENHWAYEAVSRLAGNGIVEGYEDGKYHGERQMTRYEMAEIIYNALSKGAKAEKKLVEEFRPELQAMAAQKKA